MVCFPACLRRSICVFLVLFDKIGFLSFIYLRYHIECHAAVDGATSSFVLVSVWFVCLFQEEVCALALYGCDLGVVVVGVVQ